MRVNAAIGGWAFNDAPTQYLFSNMSSTYENRQTFISSVMSYLTKYGLDGIDIGAFLAPSIGLLVDVSNVLIREQQARGT